MPSLLIPLVYSCLSLVFLGVSLAGQQGEVKPYRVLMISAEQSGVLATGGLGHATADLAKALNEAGIRTDVLMPRYLAMEPAARAAMRPTGTGYAVELDRRGDRFVRRERFSLLEMERNGGRTYFLEHHPNRRAKNYFANVMEKGRTTYGPAELEKEAFGAFDKAAVRFIQERGGYDFVILNDWHAGPVAAFLQQERLAGRPTPKVITAIHNMAYQGRAPPAMLETLGLDRRFFHPEGLEFYGDVNFLKAGLEYSDMIYTVSPSYAEEIATSRYGQGLEGVIRKKRDLYFRVTGILNGIDNSKWDPAKLPVPFTRADPRGKLEGKRALQRQLGLPVRDRTPVIALTSRVAEQKGFEYLPEALERVLAERDVQVFVTGDGEPRYLEKLRALAAKYPGKMRLEPFSFDNERAATAYADFFLNASWFEPSGLNQFFAMRMGTIPIVSRTGGLKDSVEDGVTGFLAEIRSHDGVHTHNEWTRDSVAEAVNRALDVYEREPETIRKMSLRGMAQDNSWAGRMPEFRALLDYVAEEGPLRLTERRPPAASALRKPSELFEASRAQLPERIRCLLRQVQRLVPAPSR